MKWYRCFISGENFPGQLIGEDYPVGFYTTRFIQAEDEDSAEMVGLDLLRTEGSFQLPDGLSPPAAAKVYFEELAEVEESEGPESQGGFSWFRMGS